MQAENPGYYAVIPSEVRYNKNICANAKLMYGEISALSNKEGYCFASNKYFSELYGVSKRTITSWISSLEKEGFIHINDGADPRRIFLGGWKKTSRGVEENFYHNNIINNINNKNNIQHSNQEETLKNLEQSFTLNKQQHLLRRDGSADLEIDQELALGIQENAPRIDVEKNLGTEVSKDSREPLKASKNGSKTKIAKSVIQAFYEYYKKLNDSFEQHTTWDARETKTLRDELLKAALPIDRMLEWKPDWVSKKNPYYKILEPAWRLLADRNKKKSDFYKKIFRPSTFTVKYIECLSELNYYDDAITQKEDPELDNDLLMLNKKLKEEIK
jgi:hypothetical protein